MHRSRYYLILFIFIMMISIALTSIGPDERILGSHAKLVYLHCAWVWTALLGFMFSATIGFVGLFTKRASHHACSIALSRASLFFWLTYLPLSLWTMQANWNGLFLAEPRWRVSVHFAIIAVLIQVGITLMNKPQWGSFLNLTFFLSLGWTLIQSEQVMHPGSPITSSGSIRIQSISTLLLLLCLSAGWFLTNWFRVLNIDPQ
jgi:hypothetical protein